MSTLTARAAGLATCLGCERLAPLAEARERRRCSRCGAPMRVRKRNSLDRTAALVAAAVIFYIPANLYPVMSIEQFGRSSSHTILNGVQELITAGMWPLAALIFFASIMVPMVKLLVLAGLVWSVQLRSTWRPRERTQLYRITEFIGRWSMIDVFVIAILVALVNLGAVATITPGIGASFFALVVVITIFAAEAFDPRRIWDVMEEPA